MRLTVARWILWPLLAALAAACATGTETQSSCEDYARVFADVAANTCRRGTFESNVAAFKASARVGDECELVQSIRDADALQSTCFPWLRQELPRDCTLLDVPERYVEALPDACKQQLQLSTP